MVRYGRFNGEAASNRMVLRPMTTSEAEGAREITVPEMEMLDPGMSV